MTVRHERTGWRDTALSARHRRWGYDCPALDIDFLMLEYHRAAPAALIEYKAGLDYRLDLEKSNYRALALLANAASIPFAVALYSPQTFAFRVLAGNYHARNRIGHEMEFSEREYVSWLYALRGLQLPRALESSLNTVKP